MAFLAGGDLVVVETDDDRYLGTAEVAGDQLVIRPGLVGRPSLVPLEAVLWVTPASEHEDVVEDSARTTGRLNTELPPPEA